MLAKSDEFVERTTPAKVIGVVSGKTEKTGNYTAVRTGTDYVEIGCAPDSRGILIGPASQNIVAATCLVFVRVLEIFFIYGILWR